MHLFQKAGTPPHAQLDHICVKRIQAWKLQLEQQQPESGVCLPGKGLTPAARKDLPLLKLFLTPVFYWVKLSCPRGSQLSQRAARTQAVILIQNQTPVCSLPNRGCCTCSSRRWLMVTMRLPRGCKSNGHRGMRTAELTPPQHCPAL